MQRNQVTSDARLAGQVLRYHTWPVHHRQSIGEHTWQVMRIYWQIFGALSPQVSTYLLWHDAGELKVGDPPFPVKQDNPRLKRELDAMEGDAVYAMGGPGPEFWIDDAELLRCKLCDLLDMNELGRHELAQGNRFAQPIVDDTCTSIVKLLRRLSALDQLRVWTYVSTGGRPQLCT